jgi:hypothetical protein
MVRRVGRLLASGGKTAPGNASLKQRYEEAKRRRAAILERPACLNDAARAHPAYRSALVSRSLAIGHELSARSSTKMRNEEKRTVMGLELLWAMCGF